MIGDTRTPAASPSHCSLDSQARAAEILAAPLPVHLVIFDIDGTLTDTNADDDRLYRDALRAGLPEDAAPTTIGGWEDFPHVTDPGIARQVITRVCGRPAREGEIFEIRRAFIAAWERGLSQGTLSVQARPGARRLFEEARARPGVALAIATGGWGPTARMKLQRAGLLFEEIVLVTADQAETRPAILRTASILAAAARNLPGFDRTLVVGDGIWDARAARDAGMSFIGVASDPANAVRLRGEGASDVIPHFEPPGRFWTAVDTALQRSWSARDN